MIEEIKRRLKGGRVFLKCINKEGFISENKVNREILNLDEIEVQYYQKEGVEAFEGFQLIVDEDFLEDRDLDIDDMFIGIGEIAYFEIVKNNPTFDDLIDAVVKAYKNRLLDIFLMNDEVITVFNYDATGTKEGINRIDTSKYYQFINFINSLYTETFVIEKDGDITKLKGEPKITLANGNEFIAKNMKMASIRKGMHAIHFIDVDGYEVVYVLFELKGATVTQKR